jgi:hypothetical protein
VQCIFSTISGSIASHGAADRESLIGDRDGDIDSFAQGTNNKAAERRPVVERSLCHLKKSGAGEGIRTLDPDLGKVVLYH